LTKKDYRIFAIETDYWRPRTDYLQKIFNVLKGKLQDGDLVTISEKAISTASGKILDESTIHPSMIAHFFAKYWMRYVWGYFLGILCHMKKKTIQRLRAYPIYEGSAHKQTALSHVGFWQALMYGSEGGIDGSNLPYSFVSLPLENPQKIAKETSEYLKAKFGKHIEVMILDTDKTYSFRNFHFTPRPSSIRGIKSCSGLPAYAIGRFLKLKRRATPIALTDYEIDIEEALKIAELANRARGFGAGRNVWDMAEAYGVELTKVTWDMLDQVEHKPIVIIRRLKPSQQPK